MAQAAPREAREAQCSECGKAFKQARPHQVFCSSKCRRDFHNLMGGRGVMAMPLLAAWRGGKHGKAKEEASYAFAQLCALADGWAAQDRKAGRNSLPLVSAKMSNSWRAVDALG